MQNKTDKGTLLVSKSLSVANSNSVCRLFSARMNKYYVSIRELRLYINDYLSGEIEDTELDEYRENIKGKFVIVNIVPFVMGGAQIYICFMDCPSKVFSSWVYSSVDEENEVVLEYICKGLSYVGEEPGYTKEEIRRIMSEHPEIKAW